MALTEFDLFRNTPYIDVHFPRWNPSKRIAVVVAFAWVPLLITSLFEGTNFSLVVITAIRFLISLPLLIWTGSITSKKLRKILCHFSDAHILFRQDLHRLDEILSFVRKVRDSHLFHLVLWLIVYVLTFYDILKIDSPIVGTIKNKSPGALWFSFVARPIFWYALLYYLFSVLSWSYLIARISMMNLRIRPSHGDGVGGLAFLSKSISAFNLSVLSLSIAAASGVASMVLYRGLSLTGVERTIGLYVLILLSMHVLPLTLFYFRLKKTKRTAIFSYGILSANQLEEFEKKWIRNYSYEERSTIESGDFSATYDTSSLVERVQNMKMIPIKMVDLIRFSFAAILPFLPVVALRMPWEVFLSELMKVVKAFI